MFLVQPEVGHCQAPKHVVVPYAVYYLHTTTNKRSCVRQVHKLNSSKSRILNAERGDIQSKY